MSATRQGNIFILSGASGTGKGTLISRIISQNKDIRVSISHTTRAPRVGEQDGQHYYFVDKNTFTDLVGQGAFLEYAEVFGHFYGTSVESVKSLSLQGYDVILEIDVQGAAQIRRVLPEAISIFILPPSLAALKERLHKRQTDTEAVILRRLSQAAEEISHALAFDYVVVNDCLEAATESLSHIILAVRYLQKNQSQMIEKVLQNQ